MKKINKRTIYIISSLILTLSLSISIMLTIVLNMKEKPFQPHEIISSMTIENVHTKYNKVEITYFENNLEVSKIKVNYENNNCSYYLNNENSISKIEKNNDEYILTNIDDTYIKNVETFIKTEKNKALDKIYIKNMFPSFDMYLWDKFIYDNDEITLNYENKNYTFNFDGVLTSLEYENKIVQVFAR